MPGHVPAQCTRTASYNGARGVAGGQKLTEHMGHQFAARWLKLRLKLKFELQITNNRKTTTNKHLSSAWGTPGKAHKSNINLSISSAQIYADGLE